LEGKYYKNVPFPETLMIVKFSNCFVGGKKGKSPSDLAHLGNPIQEATDRDDYNDTFRCILLLLAKG